MVRTYSLNCLSCRNPYQTAHSLNTSPLLSSEKKYFVSSPSQKSAPTFLRTGTLHIRAKTVTNAFLPRDFSLNFVLWFSQGFRVKYIIFVIPSKQTSHIQRFRAIPFLDFIELNINAKEHSIAITFVSMVSSFFRMRKSGLEKPLNTLFSGPRLPSFKAFRGERVSMNIQKIGEGGGCVKLLAGRASENRPRLREHS